MITVGMDCSALDATFKEHAQRGIGRYVRALLAEFRRSPDPSITVAHFDHRSFHLPGMLNRLIDNLPAGRQTIRQQLCYPVQLRQVTQGFDVVHFPAHMDAPSWSTQRLVITVLDLIPLVCADLYRAAHPSWRFRLARWLENRAIQNAALILAISENTASDIHRLLGVPREKIVVTPLGIEDRFFAPCEGFDQKALRARYHIPLESPFVLYVGGIDPRKNYRTLLQTIKQLRARCVQDARAEPALVMVGNISQDREYPSLIRCIEETGLRNAVHELGFVPDADLIPLYKSAGALYFPSLYEGFGLTPLEAMAAGTPVVSSNTSAMPEVIGDGALLVPPLDVAASVTALYAALFEQSVRESLIRRGPAQAKKFTWERTARLTREAYRRAFRSHELLAA